MIETNSASEFDLDYKGVPGFSGRLSILFNMAGAPKDTRLAWGAAKWGCAPNTIGNWIKNDSPPQRFTTLQAVVADLLDAIPGRYDPSEVIGWLYTGGHNPFQSELTKTSPAQIDHILQVKIFNHLYQMCMFTEIDFDSIEKDITNRMISITYWYLIFRQQSGLSADVRDATFLLKIFVGTLQARNILSSD